MAQNGDSIPHPLRDRRSPFSDSIQAIEPLGKRDDVDILVAWSPLGLQLDSLEVSYLTQGGHVCVKAMDGRGPMSWASS